MNILRFLSDDKKKEQERKNRIQHPHLVESRKHWDWEQAYYDLYPKKDKGEEK